VEDKVEWARREHFGFLAWLGRLERSNRAECLHAHGLVVKAMLCVHICKKIKRHNVCEIFVVLFG
jgi:hypothetical protein